MPTQTGTEIEDVLVGSSNADVISGRGGADDIDGGQGDDVIYGFDAVDTDPNSGAIAVHQLTTGLDRPIGGASPPGDPGRLFVLEQHTGKIQIVDLSTGAISATPFLDIPDNQLSHGGEEGLLGIAFDPNYATNGKFYVDLTNAAGNIELWEYTRSANPDVADPASKRLVLGIDHPTYVNHNGGQLAFGPDGYLYVGVGDGGFKGDPNNNAQNKDALLGKILRIDVHGDDFPSDPDRNYAIPADNPFAGAADGADEVWAYGLRNPWRFSFDPLTNDLYIGDVGQAAREEIDYVAAGTPGGLNFGWRLREGLQPYNPPGGPPDPSLTDPILDYGHDASPFGGEAIIGGYAYRGPGGAQGLYFFADYITGHVWATRQTGGAAHGFLNLDPYLQFDAGAIGFNTSFAVDGTGRLYLMEFDGTIFRLTPSAGAGDDGDALKGGEGDDQIYGGAGADTLDGGPGNDLLQGGLGVDTATYADAPSGVSVRLDLATAQDTLGGGIDTLTGVENLTGSDFNDVLTGDGGANVLVGGPGDDVLKGGAGEDLASYADAPSGVTVRLSPGAQDTGGAGIDTLSQFEDVQGSAFNDVLTGNSLANRLTGGAGADRLAGGNGADALDGGDGNDVLAGGAGDDLIAGGAGTDAVSYAGAPGAVTVVLGLTTAQDTLGAGVDTLSGVENLVGSAFDDSLSGSPEDNRILGGGGIDSVNGGAGDDVLDGGTGDDTLRGSDGADALKGRDGVDRLLGGSGRDVLAGGTGADFFVYSALSDTTTAAPDLITDFGLGDRINLRALDADAGTAGDQAFHLGATPGHVGDLVVTYDAKHGRTVVDIYVDADSTPDARIWLMGDHAGLAASDFVL